MGPLALLDRARHVSRRRGRGDGRRLRGLRRRGAGLGRQRLRHGDQLSGSEERAGRRPGAGAGLRRRRAPRATRSSSRPRAAILPHDAEDPRPGRRYVAETFSRAGRGPGGRDRPGLPLHVARSTSRIRSSAAARTWGSRRSTSTTCTTSRRSSRRSGRDDVPRGSTRGDRDARSGAPTRDRSRAWGLATWNGLRVPPEHPEHLSLAVDARAGAERSPGRGITFGASSFRSTSRWREAVGFRSQETAAGALPALERAARPRSGGVRLGFAPAGAAPGDLPEEIVEAFPEARHLGPAGPAVLAVGSRNDDGARRCFELPSTPWRTSARRRRAGGAGARSWRLFRDGSASSVRPYGLRFGCFAPRIGLGSLFFGSS